MFAGARYDCSDFDSTPMTSAPATARTAPRSRGGSSSTVGTGGAARGRYPSSASASASTATRRGVSASGRVRGTGGCTTATTSARLAQRTVIVAIAEGRGNARGEIGMATVDLRRPVVSVSQFSDTTSYVRTFTKLALHKPAEIVLPSTANEGGSMSKLCAMVQQKLPDVKLVTVKRKYFNDDRGMTYVQQLCDPDYAAVHLDLQNKYYALSCVAALLKYVEYIQNVMYAPRSLRIEFRGSEQTTMIDATTARNLELLHNRRDPQNTTASLYGVINRTQSITGARLLRSEILQPPCGKEVIERRLDSVQELLDNEDAFSALSDLLGRFIDVDHLVSLCIQIPKQETPRLAESRISHVVYLKHTLGLVRNLGASIAEAESDLLTTFASNLRDPRFKSLQAKLDAVISPDVHREKGGLAMQQQRVFAVKEGVNGLLDVARKTYSETVDDVSELVAQLRDLHDLAFQVGHSTQRGYFALLKTKDRRIDLPPEFQQIKRTKSAVSATTKDLRQMNDRIAESLQEIYLLSNDVISELLAEVREDIGCLHKLTETVGMLDLLRSLAELAIVGIEGAACVRPEFTDTLAVKKGVHPVLHALNKAGAATPNDAYVCEATNFLVVTGPNMSGKSVYLVQTALLQVMAQIGCFVPAEYASFRICDQVFSRIGTEDRMETNSSTFTLECEEINYILQNVTDRSLVIADELGRGTSSQEGIGICFAVCEQLLQTKAFTLFATHFTELTTLSMYPNAENYHFTIQQGEAGRVGLLPTLVYTHHLAKGGMEEEHYGIQLAATSSLPTGVLLSAKALAERLGERRRAQRLRQARAMREETRTFQLASRLVQVARSSDLDDAALRAYLHQLQQQLAPLQAQGTPTPTAD